MSSGTVFNISRTYTVLHVDYSTVANSPVYLGRAKAAAEPSDRGAGRTHFSLLRAILW